MVTVTSEDLLELEHVERELASAGRDAAQAAVRKALTVLRQTAITRLERDTRADALPTGTLPPAVSPLSALNETETKRLEALQDARRTRPLTAPERRELQELRDAAEAGAMRNVLALVRDQAPDSDAYLRSLRAYRRSFNRLQSGRGKTARQKAAG